MEKTNEDKSRVLQERSVANNSHEHKALSSIVPPIYQLVSSDEKTSDPAHQKTSIKPSATDAAVKSIVPPVYQLVTTKKEESETSDIAAGETTQLSSTGDASPGGAGVPIDAGGSDGNGSGLPQKLKSGLETMSGFSMDDVKIHKNSSKPAQLKAHAYAQGSDIHLGPGQEQHLPHEAWHVVQQKQGRVSPTVQLKGYALNTDDKLEQEADIMGNKAAQSNDSNPLVQLKQNKTAAPVAQMKFTFGEKWRATGYFGSYLGGWTETQIEAEKNKFNKSIEDLKLATSGLKKHNYYANLNTFTSGEKKKEFEDLKLAIDKYVLEVEALESEPLLWSKKDEMESTMKTKSIEVEKLMDKFSEFSDGALNQATDENEQIQSQKEILSVLGVTSTKYAQKVDKTERATRKSLKNKNLVSSQDKLVGKKSLEDFKGKVTNIKSTYKKAEKVYNDEQVIAEEQRRIEKEARDKKEQGEQAYMLKRQKIIAKIDSGNIVEFERYFDSDYTKIESILDHKGKLKASNVLTLARAANASENLGSFISLLNSGFDLNKNTNLLSEKGSAFILDWKDHVNLTTDKNTLDVILEQTPENKKATLKSLLANFDAKGLNALLKQTSYNYQQITDLFTKADHTKEEIAALQQTYAKENTIALLREMPNTKKLLALTNTLSNEIELRNLIADIKGKSDATNVVETEIGKDTPSSAAIYGDDEVQKARGLKGVSGNLLEAKKTSDFSSDHERRSIQATLSHINGGPAPSLSHDTTERPAKFNEHYGNAERLLPANGTYREYYVQKSANATTFHGSRRLVKDTDSGRIYYTNEHYQSFCRLLS